MKIIDNYVSEEESRHIREVLTSNVFPWNYCDKIVTTQDNDRQQFTHVFYFEGEPQSPYYHNLLLREFLTNLDACALIKVKANLQTKTESIIRNAIHTDHTFPNAYTGIYYVNDNDGYTFFEDGTCIDSVANRMVIFPSHLRHSGTTCTNSPYRSVINVNFFPVKNSEY
ncbi:DNA endonuclease V [Synechococcus phage S-H9-1]|uniref:DNA endonuclease V n=1 Tax=Synechococcus phage S-H9-1 TaxID=2783674 RepID=A0A873WJ81_9CAUD|nr:DNA endonuclease V [Synechococcus phage S-H9-1]QPB08075.1 DNA endonuclease V [Synechococcus phage S-H9-1]